MGLEEDRGELVHRKEGTMGEPEEEVVGGVGEEGGRTTTEIDERWKQGDLWGG